LLSSAETRLALNARGSAEGSTATLMGHSESSGM
jgi:hypothetical protein